MRPTERKRRQKARAAAQRARAAREWQEALPVAVAAGQEYRRWQSFLSTVGDLTPVEQRPVVRKALALLPVQDLPGVDRVLEAHLPGWEADAVRETFNAGHGRAECWATQSPVPVVIANEIVSQVAEAQADADTAEDRPSATLEEEPALPWEEDWRHFWQEVPEGRLRAAWFTLRGGWLWRLWRPFLGYYATTGCERVSAWVKRVVY